MFKNVIYKNILEKNNISENDLLNFISDLPSGNLFYSDIFLQNSIIESLSLEQKIIKNNFLKIINGFSTRVIHGDKTIFYCSNNISFNSILNSIKNINKIYFNKNILSKFNMIFLPNITSYYEIKSPINFNLNKNKIDLLFYLDNYIRKKDKRIKYVYLNLFSTYDIVLIISTDNVFIGDIRPLINLSIKIKLEDKLNQEIGFSGGGGRYSYDEFISIKKYGYNFLECLADESIRMGLNNLNAIQSPYGIFPVILGSGLPGILLHEAVGHGLEGDSIRKNTSIYYNLLGKKVASNYCTVIDNPTLNNKRGSLNIDDEGTITKKNILIKNGILKSFMLDKLNARLMNLNSTGNARRESYNFLPIPRMTNTYMLPGKYNLKDLINSIDYGLYIINLSGGQVDITSGKFVFTISEGYLIKNGRIINSIKLATLIGSNIKIMNNISMISNNLEFDNGLGICGKEGQNIPVCVGQPALKIDSIMIGGIKV